MLHWASSIKSNEEFSTNGRISRTFGGNCARPGTLVAVVVAEFVVRLAGSELLGPDGALNDENSTSYRGLSRVPMMEK